MERMKKRTSTSLCTVSQIIRDASHSVARAICRLTNSHQLYRHINIKRTTREIRRKNSWPHCLNADRKVVKSPIDYWITTWINLRSSTDRHSLGSWCLSPRSSRPTLSRTSRAPPTMNHARLHATTSTMFPSSRCPTTTSKKTMK